MYFGSFPVPIVVPAGLENSEPDQTQYISAHGLGEIPSGRRLVHTMVRRCRGLIRHLILALDHRRRVPVCTHRSSLLVPSPHEEPHERADNHQRRNNPNHDSRDRAAG